MIFQWALKVAALKTSFMMSTEPDDDEDVMPDEKLAEILTLGFDGQIRDDDDEEYGDDEGDDDDLRTPKRRPRRRR